MDDTVRYREALQESLLTEGWEEAFDYNRLREWVQNNRERLRAMARDTLGEAAVGHENHFANNVESYSPERNYDLPMTEAVFRPIFDALVKSACAIGLRPVREVELVTSTSISPTPLARPTTGTHQLFVGLGTSTFCNYWAKAYTAIVKAIAGIGSPYEGVTSPEDLRERLSQDPRGIILAARLSLYYAVTSTLIGFGEVEQPPDYVAYRRELLNAMEVFALSHEYSHFLADERQLTFIDKFGEPSNSGLEFFCDVMGLQISRNWGSQNDNWLAFSGVGGLAFFRAVDTCEACTSILADIRPRALAFGQTRAYRDAGQDTHPPINERASNLIRRSIETTCDEQKRQVESFLTEYDLICTTISTYVSDILSEALTVTG
jgi:hypothetical protein